MCRSISEIRLFKCDNDKVKYLQLISTYCEKFHCSILAYCLMDNHVHIQLEPKGCDVSKFMHGINLCYAQYYNRKYKRHGHVFQGRFTSKIIDTDEYNLVVSAYIHNNPKEIPKYRDNVHSYSFSSYSIYLNYSKNQHKCIDPDYILSYFNKNKEIAKMEYADFVTSCNTVEQQEDYFNVIDSYMLKERYEYRSERNNYPRNMHPDEVINLVANTWGIDALELINVKYKHQLSIYRAICVFLVRCFCNYSYKDICRFLGNITLSNVAKLSEKGYYLIKNEPQYQHLFSDVLEKIRAA